MNIRRKMALTYLEEKFIKYGLYWLFVVIIFLICGSIHSVCNSQIIFSKEYWRFQNNSFQILLKKKYDKDNLYIINYILEGDSIRNDIQIFIYFIFWISIKLHNNFIFSKYKINYSELYDFLIYNAIFNFWITFPLIAIVIEMAYYTMPYIPVYTFLCFKIFIDMTEKFFKIEYLKQNKTEWKFFTKKTV